LKKITIALSGNPNCGKTTVFNALTGARQHIANYPGVTVEKKFGKVLHKGHEIEVVDLPGTYSLTAYSLEEIVARDFLISERPDVVIDIVDASNLDRNLYLAVQFKELGVPMIVALNMMDIATSRNIIIDHELLATLMGIPVVPTVARIRKGLEELLDKVLEVTRRERDWEPLSISYGSDIDEGLIEIKAVLEEEGGYDRKYNPRWLALKYMEGDAQILEIIHRSSRIRARIEPIRDRVAKHIQGTLEDEPEGIVADHRYGFITGITKRTVKHKIESRLSMSDKIDRILTNRVLGPAVMLLILYGIFEITFRTSEIPVALLEGLFEWMKGMLTLIISEGRLQSLLVSGVIDGVGGVLGFVPLIMVMFFFIAIMEDLGYMARVAYMLDRVLRWFGLHGNSVMALLISGGISGGCAVPGVMATRTLRDPKERVATLLVVPFMNCGAKLPVFGMLIAAFFSNNRAGMLFFLTLLSWAFALLAAKFLRSTVLRGEKTPFVMELPPYRIPTLQGLFIHTWERTWQYVKKAGTVILAISIILWAVMTFPSLSEDRQMYYEEQRAQIQSEFMASPPQNSMIQDKEDLTRFLQFRSKPKPSLKGNDSRIGTVSEDMVRLSEAVDALEERNKLEGSGERLLKAAEAYISFREAVADVNRREKAEAMRQTVAGRIGVFLEGVTRYIGFDYKTNIALLGGFAAKEIVLSALGTAYSLGDISTEDGGSLQERLRTAPGWNPLVAFTLIVFVMLYVPCFVTVISISKESSWRWALFSVFFNLIAAYTTSFVIFRAGTFLGFGLS
jgi:ferrous iron transport protein B